MDVGRLFIGAGCNRIVNNVSWGACDLVAFGAQNAVAIFCPKTAQILTTLPGHNSIVNCTYWLPSTKFAFKAKHLERHYLLSGDAGGVIILWELSLAENKWRNVLQVPQSHKKGVTCIAGFFFSQNDALFASTSSDGTVQIWDLVFPTTSGGDLYKQVFKLHGLVIRKIEGLEPQGDCGLSCLDTIFIGSKTMVALSLAELPGSKEHLVLAMGGLDNKIHLYSGERKGKFVRACELKGHTDWIRSLDFSLPLRSSGDTDTLLLVSSSQDRGIRLWKITLRNVVANSQKEEKISLASYIDGPVFAAGSFSYQISLESLFIGHEDWVYSVEWQPPITSCKEGIDYYQPQSILSASMDKTMMIWQPERTAGIWMNVVTVGELSHCALGFYGGHWNSSGDAILSHGYGGSFHLWRNVGVDGGNWLPQNVPSGHFGSVTDIEWAKSGEYLLSVSHDQTTRIFAPWLKESHLENNENTWNEIARPQIHGHDINCVTIIQGKGNHRFVSGADEKVARVFEAPLSFLKTLNHATLQKSNIENLQADVQILGANMSALGLSQKPIYVQAVQEVSDRNASEGFDTMESIPDAVPVELTEPPIEEQLAWNTLWPESHKLYGHGNELFSLCCDHGGRLVASSCKAQSAAVAEIWLWQVGSWKAVGRLQSHSLTVTHMEFSHDDRFLLAVSRDRQFSVFSIKETGADEISYELVARQEAHKRIIWACSWNPFNHEFATGSRDKTVKIWSVENGTSVKLLVTLPPYKTSVTALSWIGHDSPTTTNSGVLAVGMETGLIEFWSVLVNRGENGKTALGATVSLLMRMDPVLCHVSAVQRLAWRNRFDDENESRRLQLASCGADHTVRVFEVKLH